MDRSHVAIFSIIALAFILVAPSVYAVVEPHILITMDAGQTTKPFQIKDNFNNEIFSIDVDGTVFPVPPIPTLNLENLNNVTNTGCAVGEILKVIGTTWQCAVIATVVPEVNSGLVVLNHQQSTEISVVFPSGESLSDATKIATWKITFDNTNVDFTGGTGNWGGGNGVFSPEHCMSGYIKSSGSPEVELSLTMSPDNVTYQDQPMFISSGTSSYSAEEDCDATPIQDFICADFNGTPRNSGGADTFCYLSLAMKGDQAGTGFLKGFIFHQSLFLPDGATIEKVFP